MSSPWISHLNEEQKEAALHNYGPLLILAGAGSGKTTVLVSRSGRLIDEKIVSANQLCVLTFTNRAARELKHRVTQKLGERAKGVWAGTFHSFGLQFLRRHHKRAGLPKQFGIIDPSDAGAILKELIGSFHNADKNAYDADRLLSLLSDMREKGETKARSVDDYDVAAEWLLPRYLKRLEHLGLVDFDGLLLKPLELMKEDPSLAKELSDRFQQVMVDEFQDTNMTQMAFLRIWADNHRNLAVVGDDDQSIYGWRGACIKNILDFPKTYTDCKVIRLEQNYRSSPAILDIANAVIRKNTQRHDKTLRASRAVDKVLVPEVQVYQNDTEEAEHVTGEICVEISKGRSHREIAVLYRSNAQGALLEAELRRNQIPYNLSGGTAFFDRKEIRDVLAWVRSAHKPNEVAFRRILTCPPRGIGEKTLDILSESARHHAGGFIGACRHWAESGVEARAGQSLDALFIFLDKLKQDLISDSSLTAGGVLLRALHSLRFKDYLEKVSPNALSTEKRWRFVTLFSEILDRYMEKGGRNEQSLKEFLDAMELRDSPDDDEKNEVQLLTLHACKGLEFEVVFFIGIEEDIIPHKTLGSDVAEERRLFYVGVTRAKEKLYLSRCRERKRQGKMQTAAPSRFLLDIPREMVVNREGQRPVKEENRKALLADLYGKLEKMGV